MGLLEIGRSGLNAAQTQLDTTGHNIANVNTEGYSRRRVEQEADAGGMIGRFHIGQGTYISDITRVYNEFSIKELRISQTSLASSELVYEKHRQLDEVFSQTGTIVPQSFNDMFAALNAVVDSPSSIGLRSNFLFAAEQFSDSVNSFYNTLRAELTQTNEQIAATVRGVNAIGVAIADVNQAIIDAPGYVPELDDEMDNLLLELAKYGHVSAIDGNNGTTNVMFGGAIMLVNETNSATLGVTTGEANPEQTRLTVLSSGNAIPINANQFGGQIGAYLDYRDNTLLPSMDEVSLMALGVMDAFNTQQAKGIDLFDNIGTNLFTDINDPLMQQERIAAFSNNTGSAVVNVQLDNIAQLTADTYQLDYDGAAFTLTNLTNNTSQAITYTAGIPATVVANSGAFTINIDDSANLAAGDSWQIRPSAMAAKVLAVQMQDPKLLAAQAVNSLADSNIIKVAANVNGNLYLQDVSASVLNSGDYLEVNVTNGPDEVVVQRFDNTGALVATVNSAFVAGDPGVSISAFGIEFDISEPIAGDNYRINLGDQPTLKVSAQSSNVEGPLTVSQIDTSVVNFPAPPTPAGVTEYIDIALVGGVVQIQHLDSTGAVLATDNTNLYVSGTTPSISITFQGVSFDITNPTDGDQFSIDFDWQSSGDNLNAISMGEIIYNKGMLNGDSTIIDIFQEAKQDVGSLTSAANVLSSTNQGMYDQAYSRVQGVSGVNLDEEAANLLRFQQAYQASARVISTASTIFDTLYLATS